jgi:hypothetical protein
VVLEPIRVEVVEAVEDVVDEVEVGYNRQEIEQHLKKEKKEEGEKKKLDQDLFKLEQVEVDLIGDQLKSNNHLNLSQK